MPVKFADNPPETLLDLPPKVRALKALKDSGLTIKQAAPLVGYSYTNARGMLSKYKVSKQHLITGDAKLQKIAKNSIKALASGQIPVGSDIEEVKDSTCLAAARYISDHNDPVVQVSAQLNEVNIRVFDMSGFE